MPGHRRGADPDRDSGQPDRRHSAKRGGRLLKVALLGGAVALLVSEDLRNQLLDVLFGAEEEFDYNSVTDPIVPGSETLADDEAHAVPDAHDDASEPPLADPAPPARVSPSPSAWEDPSTEVPAADADADAPPAPPRDWWSPGEASPPPGTSSDD
jgi:hypothetical protein